MAYHAYPVNMTLYTFYCECIFAIRLIKFIIVLISLQIHVQYDNVIHHTLLLIGDPSDEFLLFSDPFHKQLYHTSTSGDVIRGIPMTTIETPVSSVYDIETGRFFWVDIGTKYISSASMNGADQQNVYKLSKGKTPAAKHVIYRHLAIKNINWHFLITGSSTFY